MSIGILNGNIYGMAMMTASVNLGAIPANNTAEAGSIPLTGVAVGDIVIPIKPSLDQGIAVVQARVTAANTIALTVTNPTSGSIDPAAETYTFLVIRPENTALPTKAF